MSTEPTVAPDAETQNPAPEVVETPEVTTPDAQASAEATPEAKAEDEADKALKRMQRRIDKRTADIYRTRAENEQLKQRLAELEARAGTTEQAVDTSDPVKLAREISKIERFTEKANAIVATGSKEHPDYLPVLKDLSSEVGDFVKPNGAPSGFMEVVLEVSEKPHALLYYLGQNPEIASELADLSAIQLAKRLDRIEREMIESSKPKPSSAPKPIEPVKARGSSVKDPKDMTDQEFAAWRRAQIAARGR